MSESMRLLPEEVSWYEDLGQSRICASERQQLRDKRNLAEPGADTRGAHMLGALGEMVNTAYHRIAPPQTVNTFHGPPDVPPDWECRHSYWRGAHLLVRPTDPPRRRYVLTIGRPPVCLLPGWIWFEEARRDCWWRDYAWWVPQSALHPMPTPQWWVELGAAHA